MSGHNRAICVERLNTLGWFPIIALERELARDVVTLALAPAIGLPFAGFGLIIALLSVPAEAWLRERTSRARNDHT